VFYMKGILVTGSAGAIGRNQTLALRARYGSDMVVAGYNRTLLTGSLTDGPSVQVDVTDKEGLRSIIEKHKVGEIYHNAALLSIKAEKNPEDAENVNVGGLENVLEVARKYDLKVFWPSSIAVFGSTAPKDNTPQDAPLDPEFEYGRNKKAGEALIKEAFEKSGVDVRSVRYPGINGRGKPGPGTTEYAIEMIYAAVGQEQGQDEPYVCPLRPDTALPMMDMRDATRAALEIMGAPQEQIRVRTSYNLAAISFTPVELEQEIKRLVPGFRVRYDETDELKQKVADSWPHSIDDSAARKHFGWRHQIGLEEMAKYILEGAREDLLAEKLVKKT